MAFVATHGFTVFARSTIVGTITGAEDHSALSNVVVTATSPNLSGERVVVSDAKGEYKIAELPPGPFSLTYELEGFHPFKRADVKLALDRTLRVNVEMLPEKFKEATEEVPKPRVNLSDLLITQPESVDLRSRQSPIRDQGGRGTCTAFGVMAALESLPGVPIDLSEQWAYGEVKLHTYSENPDRPYDQGSLLARYWDFLRLHGVMAEEVMPYNPAAAIWKDSAPSRERFEKDLAGARIYDLFSFPRWTWKLRPDASEYRAGKQAKDVDWIRAQLWRHRVPVAVSYLTVMPYWMRHDAKNYMSPVDCVSVINAGVTNSWQIAGLKYGSNLVSRIFTGEFKLQARSPNKLEGGHAVTIVGYDHDGFIIKNSWGKQWGNEGYGKLTYNFHQLFAVEVFTVRTMDFSPTKTTNSSVDFTDSALALKVVPSVNASGKPALELSLVWHGPGLPVVWKNVSYTVLGLGNGELRSKEFDTDTADEPPFKSGYDWRLELPENATTELSVHVQLRAPKGPPKLLVFTHVKNTAAEYQTSN